MRRLLFLILICTFVFQTNAQKDSTHFFSLPDSVHAVTMIADITVHGTGKKENYAGITASGLRVLLEADKKEREVSFEFPRTATLVATGLHTEKEGHAVEWTFDWKDNTAYRLLIASAGDSAQNFALYSGYIYLPEQKAWKLLGTVRMEGNWNNALREPGAVHSNGKKSFADASFMNVWVQRSGNGWKQLTAESSKPPVLTPMINTDSAEQFATDKRLIEDAIRSGTLASMQDTAGVYYFIKEPGHGQPVSITDTVTVHYRLTLFPTNALVEDSRAGEQKEPPTFPLNRLIRGWQLAIPKVRTGGKVQIIIPSGLAYSIRTRSAKIPPNSILLFEVEVLGKK